MANPTTSIFLNGSTPAAPSGDQNVTFQSDNASPQQSVTAVPQRATSSLFGTVRHIDNETVSGSGTAWTLANAPSPTASLILVQRIPNFGGIVLFQGTDYTISGATITTTNSLSSGVLKAWYRY